MLNSQSVPPYALSLLTTGHATKVQPQSCMRTNARHPSNLLLLCMWVRVDGGRPCHNCHKKATAVPQGCVQDFVGRKFDKAARSRRPTRLRRRSKHQAVAFLWLYGGRPCHNHRCNRLHSGACNALRTSKKAIHSIISHEVADLRAATKRHVAGNHVTTTHSR